MGELLGHLLALVLVVVVALTVWELGRAVVWVLRWPWLAASKGWRFLRQEERAPTLARADSVPPPPREEQQ